MKFITIADLVKYRREAIGANEQLLEESSELR